MSYIYILAALAGLAIFFALRFYLNRSWQKGWLIGPFVNGKNHSTNMPLRPKMTPTGWSIAITSDSKVDAVLTDCNGISGTIRAKYRIIGSAVPFEAPDSPPLISLYFQRKGDDWTAKGDKQYYRWYSGQIAAFTEGDGELVIPLTPDLWGSVFGGNGAANQERFAEAMKEAHRVGIVFGWSAGRSHGVTGNAVFELLEWSVG